VIQYGPSRADSARTVAAAVPGATLRADASIGNRINVMLGTNYKGTRKVTVTPAASSTPKIQTRTAVDNPCS
jgi:hypothetical protein